MSDEKKKVGGKRKPVKNNAKVTVTNENIFRNVLTDEEADIWDSLKVDVTTQMDYDLKILTIRERRMLERIKKLEECAFMEVRIEDTAGKAGNRTHTQRVVVSEASLVMIQQIEGELTRIQEKKARMLEVKHKYETTQQANDEADVSAFVTALTASISDVWDDGEGEENADTQESEQGQ